MPLTGQPGQQVAYQVYPSLPAAGGPPLVLLHGFTASSVAFDTNIEPLRQHFTVVTVDLLGHGKSDSPEQVEPYRPESAISRLVGLFDELGFERVLLCGHSLGGALALRLALDVPERLNGLIVMNSMSGAGTPQWREQAGAGMSEMAARARREGTAFLKQTRLYPAHSKRLDERSRQLLVEAFDEMTPAGMAGTAEGLTTSVNAWERHPQLDVPLLVVIGDRDRDFVAAAPGFMSRFPEELVRVAVIKDAGHAANIEQPRQFEAAVVAFGNEVGVLKAAASSGQQPILSRAGGTALTALGALLVAGGVVLLVASLFNPGGSGSSQLLAAQPPPTAAPAIVTAVAGTRAPGPGISATASATGALPTATATTVAPSPTRAATTAATAPPPPARTPTPTETPAPTPSPTPSVTPTVAPSPTPSGPVAGIAGPSTAAVGEIVTFASAAGPVGEVLRLNWSSGGQVVPQQNLDAYRARFSAPGCQVVSLTVLFKGGISKTATQAVAVGGANCQ